MSTQANFKDYLDMLTKKLTPVQWHVFYDPNYYTHPHIHYYPYKDHYHDQCRKMHPLTTTSGYDCVILDMDYEDYYEDIESDQRLVIRATVPLRKIAHAFEHYTNEIIGELLDVDTLEQMRELGYQQHFDERQGVLILRFPNPEHCLSFMERFADDGFFSLTRYEIIQRFMQALVSRFNQAVATHPDYQQQHGAVEPYMQIKATPALKREHHPHYYLQPKLMPKGAIKTMK